MSKVFPLLLTNRTHLSLFIFISTVPILFSFSPFIASQTTRASLAPAALCPALPSTQTDARPPILPQKRDELLMNLGRWSPQLLLLAHPVFCLSWFTFAFDNNY